MRKKLTLFSLFVLSAFFAIAQLRSITGKVINERGEAIPSVTIKLKNAKGGTTTDSQGGFSIAAKAGDVLVFSSVNTNSVEVKVGSQTSLSIVLNSTTSQLEEVQVTTALGIRRSKSSLPYATQQVTADELNRTPSTNVVNNLSGKIAGLQVTASNTLGGSTNVVLRGFKSLTQSNQALFVVDGVPYDNTNQSKLGFDLGNAASDINADDIESVNVLKGAAASALYGSRASNGVIVITTKKASKKKALGVTVNSSTVFGSFDKSTLPQYQLEYGQGYGSAGYKSSAPGHDGFFYWVPIFNSNGASVNVVQTNQDANTGPAYDKNLLVYNWDAFSQGNPNYGKATPWLPAAHHGYEDFAEAPVTTTNSVFVDGASDKGNFKLGFTNAYDKGILPNSNVKKNTINFGANYNLTDKLSVGANANYVSESGLNRNGYTYSVSGASRNFRQWWGTNIDLNELKDDYFRTKTNASWNWNTTAYTGNVGGTVTKAAYHNNPYWEQYENYNNDSRDRLFGNVNLNYKITNYLNFTARAAVDAYNSLFERRIAVGSVATASYEKIISDFKENNYDFLFNYDKNLSQDFNLKALFGSNIRQTRTTSLDAITNGGLIVPKYYALANSAKTPAAPVETDVRKEVDGLFAGTTVGYKDYLSLDATVRRDQSSTLPSTNNTYYYPAGSLSFVFSKLLPELNWLSFGKTRINYAEVGGDAPAYSLQNTYNAGTAFNSQALFTASNTNNNPDLRSERTQSYEAGLEVSFLHNRLGFDATYYNAKTIDQITPITPSTATGYTSFYVNGGSVQNSGIELSINAVPVKTNDFSWNIALNWSKNNSKVLSLYGGQPSYLIGSWQKGQLVAEVGKAWGILRGTDYTYLNGKPIVDANGHYVFNSNSKSDIGDINPDFLAGLTNTFKYKNWAFSFLIDAKKGGSVYSLDLDYGSYSGLYPWTAGLNDLGNSVRKPISAGGGIILPGVYADGTPNKTRIDASDINAGGYSFSSADGFSQPLKHFVFDASYVKLRELAISYSLPKGVLGKVDYIKGVDLSLTGRNLLILYKNLPYADPEQGQASGNASIGFQNAAYPTVRSIAFNIKLKF
jgi:TonB-linked SusC/RagA family outer membrane protein